MSADVLSLAVSAGGSRRFRTLLAPLAPVVGTAITIVGLDVGWAELLDSWLRLPLDGKVAIGLAILGAGSIAAEILVALKLPMIRVLAGYGPKWFVYSLFGRRMRAMTLLRSGRGTGVGGAIPVRAESVRYSPLGNALEAAFEHPQRYGIDAITVWPRLYVVLPADARLLLNSALASMDAMTVLTFGGALIAGPESIWAAMVSGVESAAIVLCVGCMLMFLGFRMTVEAGRGYGELVKSSFDVFRFKLLTDAGLTLPTSYATERAQWTQLTKLWRQGAPDSDAAKFLGYPT